MNDSIYSGFTITKNNITIPVLKSGKTIESRYNPQRDSENIINGFEKNYHAFLVLGIGSGILIEQLSQKQPDALIIVFENNHSDYSFLFQNNDIQNRIIKSNVIQSTSSTIYNDLLNHYIPAKYGDLKIISNPNWNTEKADSYSILITKISNAIENIKADFSVQSHFGKTWTCNLIKNIKLIESNPCSEIFSFNTNKTAVVVGAGPSIDSLIKSYSDKNQYYIISTDTAFSFLLKYGIKPDVVVSIDGQTISRSHFINSHSYENINFLFDLTSNTSAAKTVISKKGNLHYFVSGHPLSSLYNKYINDSLPFLYTGSGTVTITALDFAVKAGFQNIQVIGADFSYHNGKSYAKGTYLDSLYNADSNKCIPSEQTFQKLMYRTELLKLNDLYSTKVLESYRTSFIDYLNQNQLKYKYNDFVYNITNLHSNCIELNIPVITNTNFIGYLEQCDQKIIELCLLPFIAFLRKEKPDSDFEELLKLAHSFIVSYN